MKISLTNILNLTRKKSEINPMLIKDHKLTTLQIKDIDDYIEEHYNKFIFRLYKTMCNREASMPKFLTEHEQRQSLLFERDIKNAARQYAKNKIRNRNTHKKYKVVQELDWKKLEGKKVDPELANVVFLDCAKDQEKESDIDAGEEIYQDYDEKSEKEMGIPIPKPARRKSSKKASLPPERSNIKIVLKPIKEIQRNLRISNVNYWFRKVERVFVISIRLKLKV